MVALGQEMDVQLAEPGGEAVGILDLLLASRQAEPEAVAEPVPPPMGHALEEAVRMDALQLRQHLAGRRIDRRDGARPWLEGAQHHAALVVLEIGRAACRERGCQYV